LATLKKVNYEFIIHLIESGVVRGSYCKDCFLLHLVSSYNLQSPCTMVNKKIQIFHRDENLNGECDSCKKCTLRSMPNWSYSYALALYKLSFMMTTYEEEEALKVKANEALKQSILSYPSIPKLLLEKNKINITGRSFQTDWSVIISPLREIHEDNEQNIMTFGSLGKDLVTAKDKIISIFVERSHKLWSSDDVVKWLYDCCQEVVSSEKPKHIADDDSFALIRYGKINVDDFQDSFPNIPIANGLDPRLVDAAMNFRPNTRRMLRMPNQRGGEGIHFDETQRVRDEQNRVLFGTGRDGMDVIDPDLPFVEVFLRSLMPWNRVDGVPPGPQ